LGMRLSLRLLVAFALAVVLTSLAAEITNASGTEGEASVYVVDLEMNIDGGAVELVKWALRDASRNPGVEAVVIRINTDGGYLHATEEIVDAVSEADVLTVGYVAPYGARAFSAGAYIFMACQVTAMEPGTVVGSCMPVSETGQQASEKVVNAMAGWMASLAEARGRNVSAARAMVVENRDYTAEQAYRLGVCDLVVDNIGELLEVIGYGGASVKYYHKDAKIEALSFISNPVVQGILMFIASWLIIADILHPTYVLTILALVFLGLALYGIGIVSTSALAVAMMACGCSLMAVELKKPGFGLEFVGAILIILGVVFAYGHEPFMSLTGFTYLLMACIGACSGLFAYYMYHIRKVISMRERYHDLSRLVGKVGVAKTDIRPGGVGVVLVEAEEWSARSDVPVRAGVRVKVLSVEGVTVKVEPLED